MEGLGRLQRFMREQVKLLPVIRARRREPRTAYGYRERGDQADANGVNYVPLTLISLEFELDSVSCPKTGSTASG